jgi:hypothetical protein
MAEIGEASQRLYDWLLAQAENERGVHVESLLVSLGALGGFACQLAARDALTEAIPGPWSAPLVEARGEDGRSYFFGDGINHFLIESELSFCNLARAAASRLSAEALPRPEPIAAYVAGTVGSAGFGKVRFPPGTAAEEDPEAYVRTLWPQVQAIVDQGAILPQQRPAAFGAVASYALADVAQVVAPPTALHLLMESAIIAARIDTAA